MRPGPAPADAVAKKASAFGLKLRADFELPGLPVGAVDEGLPEVVLRHASAGEISGLWGGTGAQRLSEERIAGGEPDRTVDFDPDAGYLLYARYFGLALVSPDGGRVLCAPPAVAAWRWQRFLMGRVLPLAALLRGYELLHASAVAVSGRAVAMLGPSGAGKSSVAVHLGLLGAPVITDDVVAITVGEEPPRVHPGSGVLSLRDSESDLAREALDEGLAGELGWSGKSHLTAARTEGALPLGAVYFLSDDPGPVSIRRLTALDPRSLLASTLVLEVRTPARLRRQLEVCALIARTVPAFAVVRGEDGPAFAAAAIGQHAREALA